MWDKRDARTRIKLCWFEYVEAAYEASFIGADALGFHCLSYAGENWREKATKLGAICEALPDTIEKVLLIDHPIAAVEAILDEVQFDSVQLYPDWDPVDIDRLKGTRNPQLRVLKVMSAQEAENSPSDPREFLERYSRSADAILLDSSRAGGTGVLADEAYCAKIVEMSALPVMIAGGLTAENVGNRISRVAPFGVDVETGVSDRTSNGLLLKNLGKCRAFVNAVVEADRRIGRRT